MRHLISITSSCMSWTTPARQCSCRDWSRPLRLEQSANHDSNDIFSAQEDRNENSKVLLVNSEVVLIYYSGISWRVTTLAYGTSEVHEKKKKNITVAVFQKLHSAIKGWRHCYHGTKLSQTRNRAASLYTLELRSFAQTLWFQKLHSLCLVWMGGPLKFLLTSEECSLSCVLEDQMPMFSVQTEKTCSVMVQPANIHSSYSDDNRGNGVAFFDWQMCLNCARKHTWTNTPTRELWHSVIEPAKFQLCNHLLIHTAHG